MVIGTKQIFKREKIEEEEEEEEEAWQVTISRRKNKIKNKQRRTGELWVSGQVTLKIFFLDNLH